MNTAENTTVLACGLVCVVAAIVGGGVTAAGWQFPIVNSVRRQMILGIFGLALVGVALFSRSEPKNNTASNVGSKDSGSQSVQPPNDIDKFRDSLTMIIEAAPDGYASIKDRNSNSLVRMLPRAVSGELGVDYRDSHEYPFAFYEFDHNDTFENLVAKVKRALGNSWSENSFSDKEHFPQRRYWFTSPEQRTEVDVFEGYTVQQIYTLNVSVKYLKAKPR
jgi:hypothetical protein